MDAKLNLINEINSSNDVRIIRNKTIPFSGFKAVNLFGILFVRDDAYMGAADINHEEIHTAQMKEMLYVSFYLWYAAEWLVRLAMYGNARKAYRSISFEREAYANEKDMSYLGRRRRYSWTKHLKGGGV